MKRLVVILQITLFLFVGLLTLTNPAFSADKPILIGSDVLTSEKFGKAFVDKINKKYNEIQDKVTVKDLPMPYAQTRTQALLVHKSGKAPA